jgi:integrase/recombinase XerD
VNGLSATVGAIVYGFFEHHLKGERGLSPSSVASYRDAIRLFLCFVARRAGRKITRLTFVDLTADRAREFLAHLEADRGNHIHTRNQRLAALHTFFGYIAIHVPEMLAEAERVAAIPQKRAAPPATRFLERDEIAALFTQLPRAGRHALRDRALLLFLYNTGARAQEVAELRLANLSLEPQPRVQLHGKGDKWRACPLWPETARLLQQLLATRCSAGCEVKPDAPVFTAAKDAPLTRFGIYKIVRRRTANLPANARRGGRQISPHIFRHTTAVHLLEAGVEVNVIRAWLGHVSLDTTNRYAEISLKMKEDALRLCEPPVSAAPAEFHRRAVWRDDASLSAWLESL